MTAAMVINTLRCTTRDLDAMPDEGGWKRYDANGIDQAGHLNVAPELIVEVLSPGELNEQRDREVKLKLYSIHGIQEYWLVSWQLKNLEIYRHTDAQLQLVSTLLGDDVLTSLLLPGFSISVAQCFQ